MLLVIAPLRARISIVGFAAIALFAAPLLLFVPEVYNTLDKRIESFSQLSSDTSFNERSTDYQIFGDEAATIFFGSGLAVNGAYASYADKGSVHYIDGGPIETITALGPDCRHAVLLEHHRSLRARAEGEIRRWYGYSLQPARRLS